MCECEILGFKSASLVRVLMGVIGYCDMLPVSRSFDFVFLV